MSEQKIQTSGIRGTRPAIRPVELLIVLPLPILVIDGRFYFDRQSRASLERHLKSFDSIIMAMPLLGGPDVEECSKGLNFVWDPADDLLDHVQFVPLPCGSSLEFLQKYPSTSRLLRRCIDAADYLLFAIGGGNGGLQHDWGAVAAEEAIRARRRFALHADWNMFGVLESAAGLSRGLAGTPRRWKRRTKAWLVRRWQSRLVKRCDLMICNGIEVYDAY